MGGLNCPRSVEEDRTKMSILNDIELEIVPNPAYNEFVLSIKNLSRNDIMGDIVITNSLGQRIKPNRSIVRVAKYSYRVPVFGLASGTYIISIEINGNIMSDHFVISE